MTQEPLRKDEERQQLVPSVWRTTITEIVQAFSRGDFGINQGIAGVHPISPEQAARMSQNVKAYGARLAGLPEETWRTSVCQWMQGHWDVLVDLYDEVHGAIDLVLHLRVSEDGNIYKIEVRSLHVP